ncbi:hypothetical protein FY134_23135 (plasmid) [Agrobacterium fabrum]|uniref:hypothetical protein n=1 Tax=Agrobacterium fabrum TaxID=1176649 RepID=UPI000DCFCD52|nr:hypothetical protein [Agrobacterium fabrum]UXT60615.1 hypothetical protein FY134_23135 [Agrobacterium fabrum]
MVDNSRNRIFLAIVIAISTGLLLPAAFGEPRTENSTGDAWRNFIYDFQTLLTGFFAVAAAFVTFHQMQKFDAQSAKRHEEQVKLAFRPDVLLMERAYSPSVETIREWRDDMRRISSKWRAEHLQEDVYRDREIIVSLASGFIEEIERDTFQRATHLFSGKMVTLIDLLISEVHQKPAVQDANEFEHWIFRMLGWADMFLEDFDRLYAFYRRQAFSDSETIP